MRTKWSLYTVILCLLLFGVVLVTLYPFVYMVAVSLSSSIHVLKGDVTWWPKGFNLYMYKLVLEDRRIWTGYVNTVSYTVVGTLIALAVTSMGAYAISKKRLVFHKSFTLMFVFTMLFSGGMIPTFLVVKSLGFVNSFWSMVLPGAVSTWNLIIMRTFFIGIPSELEEAGRIDGLNDIGLFVRIVLPLSKAVFATIGLFYAVGIWNNFYGPLLYLRNPDLFPLQVILRNIVLAGQINAAEMSDIGGDNKIVEESLKFAAIIVSTLPILLVYPFLQKYFVKGVTVGSLKG